MSFESEPAFGFCNIICNYSNVYSFVEIKLSLTCSRRNNIRELFQFQLFQQIRPLQSISYFHLRGRNRYLGNINSGITFVSYLGVLFLLLSFLLFVFGLHVAVDDVIGFYIVSVLGRGFNYRVTRKKVTRSNTNHSEILSR